MDLKVLRFKFWKQISPTMNYFQDIGAIKKLKCIFLKKVIVKENLHLTLLTHKCCVDYKISSKLLANKLKNELTDITSEEQYCMPKKYIGDLITLIQSTINDPQ